MVWTLFGQRILCKDLIFTEMFYFYYPTGTLLHFSHKKLFITIPVKFTSIHIMTRVIKENGENKTTQTDHTSFYDIAHRHHIHTSLIRLPTCLPARQVLNNRKKLTYRWYTNRGMSEKEIHYVCLQNKN